MRAPTGARQSVHEFAWPDRVVVGTIGVPGQRPFHLQVRIGKQILDQLLTVEGNPFHAPTSTPIELVDNDDLEPVQEQAYPLAEVDADDDGFLKEDDDADPAEVLRVRMPVGTARAFAKPTQEVVGAGRPLCVICGQPNYADGHACTFPEN